MSAPTQNRPVSRTFNDSNASDKLGIQLSVSVDTGQSTQHLAPEDLVLIAEKLGEYARQLLPTARTHTTVSVNGGRHRIAPDSSRVSAPTPAQTPVQQRVRTAPQQRTWDAPITPRRSTPNRTLSSRASALPPSREQIAALRAFEERLEHITTEVVRPTEPAAWSAHSGDHAAIPHVDAIFTPRVIIDLHNRRVVADNSVQRLTYKEFELLSHLVSRAGKVISRGELFASVWRTDVPADSRTIDVHIRRLREKLGLEEHIITVRGAGYKFEFTSQVEVIPASGRRIPA
ncbi:winged helix-turn-helix domain-containing protein [Jonesia quinghaiensis]|uniref:winged helix-turn-helix domain-containing protein n=1 Tax=Jonesia quinghaiensis TaxID=262806 RepID=UPI000414EA62|nr:winged helix-turn-helix domain-containing protein [Jonesia quinghaiensis]